jgi:hypothetical protein
MKTVVIVKHVICQTAAPTCTSCDRVLGDRRLYVRSSIARKGGRPLGFGVGRFCSVRCLMRFATHRQKDNLATIRGWTFGVHAKEYEVKTPKTKTKGRPT